MRHHAPTRISCAIVLVAVATALTPIVANAQNPGFAACISRDVSPPGILGPQAALNLGAAGRDYQNLRACTNYCRSGTLPPGMGPPRGFSSFRPPYRYATYNNGRWCYCGNSVQGETVEQARCLGKMNCLVNLDAECYVNTELDHMVIDLNPPAGATVVQGGGGSAGGTSTALPPATASANRRPNPPTVQPGGWEQPFALQYEGAYQMTWRNNGDPDGDVLTFGLIIWQYDWANRRWVQLPNFRDQYGTNGMVWLRQDNFTFTTANGLSPRTHYAWMVFACDIDRGDDTLCSWSGWSLFRTQ